MEISTGTVVIAKAGKEKGGFFVVTKVLSDSALICDGKNRKLEKPKKKNIKHLQLTNYHIDDIHSNLKIRQAISKIKTGGQQCLNKT